jgi:hypothetical protein
VAQASTRLHPPPREPQHHPIGRRLAPPAPAAFSFGSRRGRTRGNRIRQRPWCRICAGRRRLHREAPGCNHGFGLTRRWASRPDDDGGATRARAAVSMSEWRNSWPRGGNPSAGAALGRHGRPAAVLRFGRGRVAQWESACFTRKRSQVQNLPRPPHSERPPRRARWLLHIVLAGRPRTLHAPTRRRSGLRFRFVRADVGRDMSFVRVGEEEPGCRPVALQCLLTSTGRYVKGRRVRMPIRSCVLPDGRTRKSVPPEPGAATTGRLPQKL